MPNKHAVATVSDPSETGMAYQVIREYHASATLDVLDVVGLTVGRGRCRSVTVTAANTAAQKDAAVLAALLQP